MARRRTITTLTEAEREEFIRAATAFHAACIKPVSSMRTDAPAYRRWLSAMHSES